MKLGLVLNENYDKKFLKGMSWFCYNDLFSEVKGLVWYCLVKVGI